MKIQQIESNSPLILEHMSYLTKEDLYSRFFTSSENALYSWLTSQSLKNSEIYVAIEEGCPLGLIQICTLGNDSEAAVTVIPQYRKKNIAEKLIFRALLNAYQKQNKISLYFNRNNTPVRKLVKRFGFKVVSSEGSYTHAELQDISELDQHISDLALFIEAEKAEALSGLDSSLLVSVRENEPYA